MLFYDSSDLQLAMALQQQEFEQQQPQRSSQQQHPQRNPQQPAISGGSKLITGPPVGFFCFCCITIFCLDLTVKVYWQISMCGTH